MADNTDTMAPDLLATRHDPWLVQDVAHDANAHAVLAAVVQLAHALGLQVVAEGVETAAQREVLQALGCDLLQGYLLARPMPAAALVAWVQGPAAGLTVGTAGGAGSDAAQASAASCSGVPTLCQGVVSS